MQKTSFSIWHNSKKDEYAGHSDFGSHIKEISCEFFPTDFISFFMEKLKEKFSNLTIILSTNIKITWC